MATKTKAAKPETTAVTDTATETIKATTEQVKGKIDQALKAFEDAGSVSKDTYEAFVSSFNITYGTKEYWSCPVISDGIMYVRRGDVLAAFDVKAK